ncbi:cyclin-J-like protein isoform X2 [Sceloporus undulatus]|uniref:cyclin-J-like protein isoform X2 n=1 Tax=Sceloporus undulatus TaxID=8520 RepID=UPI001C4B2552|nr:cyclin-J-like protein isoform X2 [Sceloporus undulatus]XP_042303975.1 cyclin-J-like protein isoform X2 [Sceloporus undulatus]
MENEWWQDELAAEIHETLREKELALPPYKSLSPLIWMRRYFADFLSLLSKRYELCPLTRHLAVYLLDLFMDCYDVNAIQLYAISVVCLLLASKFEERGDKVPMLEELNELSHRLGLGVILTKKELLKMELLLLKTINWNLCLPTPAHFIDYYLHVSVTAADRHNGCRITSKAEARYYIENYAHYFLEVSLQDHAFLAFRPSVVAAACVAASRICLKITPSWPILLHVVTQYSWEFIAPCVDLMLAAHDKDIRAAKKEKEQAVLLQQQQHMESLTFPIPAQVLFQPLPCYYPQAQHQNVPTHFQSPMQDLFAVYQASLQAPRSSSLASGNSTSPPSVSTAQATAEMVPFQTTPIQGPTVTMQVDISEDPAYYLSLVLGNSFFST